MQWMTVMYTLDKMYLPLPDMTGWGFTKMFTLFTVVKSPFV